MRKILNVTLAGVLAACVLIACDGCAGTPYKRIALGQSMLGHSVELTESFDRGTAKWAQGEHERCLKAHGMKTPEYATCIKPALDFLVHWTGKNRGKPTGRGVLPMVQSAQRATRLVLDAALDYVKANETACSKDNGKADPTCNAKLAAWKATLKPGLCALVAIIDRGIKLGAYKATESAVYKTVVGIASTICN
jgi:hypothetical protein